MHPSPLASGLGLERGDARRERVVRRLEGGDVRGRRRRRDRADLGGVGLALHAGRAEAASAARGLRKRRHLLELGVEVDALENQLRDAVAGGDSEVLLAVVEQHDADGAAVVRVDDARADVDELLDREAGPRRDARVAVLRRRDAEVRRHDRAALGGHDAGLGRGEVPAGGERAPALRQHRGLAEALHVERGLRHCGRRGDKQEVPRDYACGRRCRGEVGGPFVLSAPFT
mmetsp:Transcript_3328/g.8111  ORF Transcript_3328/g.8111 Transcript_3328/m.8111 type:complete len:230 (+) Transcript_3328:65-754(+)